MRLTWVDVNWERKSFTVIGGEQGTKNHEVRVEPLFPALLELLERIRGNAALAPLDRVIPIDNAKRAIFTACHKARLPSFMYHSLRHYFCSNAIEAGID